MVWKDSSGKALDDYIRPSIAVDVAVLTVRGDQLCVVAVDSDRGPSLPGTFLHPGETLRDAAARALETKAGITDLAFHQLGMYDDPTRDDRGWVLSMAHSAAIANDRLPPATRLVPITGGVADEPLAFDHNDMVVQAVHVLRQRYSPIPDPDNLLPDQFTLLELRRLYEAIFSDAFPKDTFRRRFIGELEGTGERSSSDTGRPAELFRRRRNPLDRR
ncbi:NUDIX domain-containing protein [Nocardia sp. 348MFTsu5.1]|uniref:NUDIX hydrolase n=1 Tax=Nocardia sp. 348MFTsu5.1 TaxID=1172185 RepID=UPI0005651606|nr:NUDIX domain-containing protein [Nocardia sp. 348MFTsu5.1]